MGSMKMRLMVLFSMVAMLLALVAPVAMADEDCDLRERGDRADRVVCDGERFTVPQFVNQAEIDDEEEFDGEDFFLLEDDFSDVDGEDFVEVEDIDCDGIADHEDWFDDQLCEVELEVFGEDFEVLVEAEEIF